MRAVVELEQAVPGGRVVEGELASGVEEWAKVALADTGAAEGVEHDIDADAGAGAIGESVEIQLADLAALEDVGLEIDAVLGGADGVEFGGVKGGTVGEDLEAAGAADGSVDERFDEVEEGVGVVGGELVAGGDLVVGGGTEDAGEHVGGEEHEGDDAEDGDPGGDGDGQEESADH